jgi:hypothetical protein
MLVVIAGWALAGVATAFDQTFAFDSVWDGVFLAGVLVAFVGGYRLGGQRERR